MNLKEKIVIALPPNLTLWQLALKLLSDRGVKMSNVAQHTVIRSATNGDSKYTNLGNFALGCSAEGAFNYSGYTEENILSHAEKLITSIEELVKWLETPKIENYDCEVKLTFVKNMRVKAASATEALRKAAEEAGKRYSNASIKVMDVNLAK